MSRETVRQLPCNSRFYILLGSLSGSAAIACFVRLHIPGDQLYSIRVEQLYGFVSLAFLYLAVLISPLSKLFGGWRWMGRLLFARRAIGVSAWYFAVLHFAVALWGQIGGFGGLALLPAKFLVALVFGMAALLVLLLMASTSFDKVIGYMTFKRWKLLHRLVYGAGILIILHVWIIGTHAAHKNVQVIIGTLLALFFALEALRIGRSLAARYPAIVAKGYFVTVVAYVWIFWMFLLLAMPGLVQSYHGAHYSAKGGHIGH